ncbi:hypothetical protein DBV05_g9015 [Lasiodiplodia theobromae]|uniref:Uncharacterized protein n=1 Tax=Lasiodiplodia theobromae TaxID=45133 RepID=A0A5N5D3P5_9PEZI|nr:hypothetical protein DBV05_g9015 [Lasiodiplodia theobromae]
MDSSELANTGSIEQQQELNPASSEDVSTSLNDGFQQFFADLAPAMPLFPDLLGQDFTNTDNLAQLPADGQVEMDENFGIDCMTEDFSWMNQHDFNTTDVVSQQAEVQPSANTPWPGAPFEVDQSSLHFAHHEMPETPRTAKIPIRYLDAQVSANQPVEYGPLGEYIPATAG